MQKKWLSIFSLTLMLIVAVSLCYPAGVMSVERTAGKKVKTKAVPGKKTPQETSSAKSGGGEAGAGKGGSVEPSPGQVNAKSGILMEVSTGSLLFEQNADEIIEPASFTKVLSLYLIFEALQEGKIHLNDEVWIGETAWRTGGSKMFVKVGTKVPLDELLKGITVVSGNDACVAVAEHLLGSLDTFVDAMNRKAKELGMSRSHFMNPHGLPAEGQVTCARDMATLGVAYLRRFPDAVRYHSMREYTYNDITQHNRNRLLLKDPTVDGLKTGFVGAAGYHLSATAQRDGMRLVAVVMGASAPAVREREAMKLLNFGFRYYVLVQPFPQGQPVTTVKVWKGQKDEIGLYPAEPAGFLISQAHKSQLRWEIRPREEITAPITVSQPLGDLVFTVSDQPKRTVALVSHEEVPLGGWFKRVWQSLLQIHKIDWRWVGGIAGGIALALVLFVVITNRHSFSRRSRSSFGK